MREHDKEIAVAFVAGILIGALALGLFIKFYVKKPPPAVKKPIARIAIVLDDFGYNYNNVEKVFRLKRPLTLSVLPNLGYSKTVAQEAQVRGYQVILHLPLEPYERDRVVRPSPDMIKIGMRAQEASAVLNKDLAGVPYAKGVSNHQGSEATENEPLMRAVFSELKRHNLFFVDSLVTTKSVCKKIAREYGVRFTSRDVFLDNREDFEYIKGQMQQLVRIAKKKGAAVGVGHDRPYTISALSILMPAAERDGIKFVFVSELAR